MESGFTANKTALYESRSYKPVGTVFQRRHLRRGRTHTDGVAAGQVGIRSRTGRVLPEQMGRNQRYDGQPDQSPHPRAYPRNDRRQRPRSSGTAPQAPRAPASVGRSGLHRRSGFRRMVQLRANIGPPGTPVRNLHRKPTSRCPTARTYGSTPPRNSVTTAATTSAAAR